MITSLSSLSGKYGLNWLQLYVTTDCNLRCSYCLVKGGEEPQYMSWPVAKRAVELLASRTDDPMIQFVGGEPLLNLDLIEKIVVFTQAWGVRYSLWTNATLIDNKVAAQLKQLGIEIGSTLAGPPVINDRLRPFSDGRGSTAATLAGLEHLKAVDIKVALSTLVSPETLDGLLSLMEMESLLGNVEEIGFTLLWLEGRAKESGMKQPDPALAAGAVSAALEHADELFLKGGRKVKFREVERMRQVLRGTRSRMLSLSRMLTVKPNGDAYPITLLNYPEFCLGNVMEEDFGKKLDAEMEKKQQLLTLPKDCLSCQDHQLCDGPAPSMIYAQQLAGDKGKPPECHLKKVFIDYLKKESK